MKEFIKIKAKEKITNAQYAAKPSCTFNLCQNTKNNAHLLKKKMHMILFLKRVRSR